MQIYGIIGYPLGHSCSPRYFNEKFQKENIALNIGASKCPTSGSFQHYYNKRPTFVVLMSRPSQTKYPSLFGRDQ